MGEPDDACKFHELDRLLHEVWNDPKSGSWFVLQNFFAWASNLPPMQKFLVWGMLSGGKQ
jgi:hypothetical protein